MRRPDLIDLQAAAVIVVATSLHLTGAALARDCGQAVPTPVCLGWAPLTGNVDADRCVVARADMVALEDDYDPRRVRTIADAPLPPHDMQLDRLKAAADRIARDCAEDSADLQ